MSATATAPVVSNRRIALAGNPNAGKTTVFNALTGLRQKVANYPGITVEKKTGRARLGDGSWCDIIDVPGTYSLEANSPDESVAAAVLRGQRADTPAPDAIIAVVDASNLARNLYLVSQLIELGKPLVVALNMMDVAKRRGLAVDPAKLTAALGVPVVPIVGHRGEGIDGLLDAISKAYTPPTSPTWPLPEAMWQELHHLGRLANARIPALTLSDDGDIRTSPAVIAARRLLADESDPALADLRQDAEIAQALATTRTRLAEHHIDPMQADIEARYRWVDQIIADAVSGDAQKRQRLTERLDAFFLHPILGLTLFAGIMGALFITIFTLADPLMGIFEETAVNLGGWLFGGLSEGPLKSLLLDGVVAGIAAVGVFVPQIALLFLFLAILEDSGYLARAAFLMDRVLSKVGLHGKSFIPMLSSFACAIPGVMAARTIESTRERLATILVAPFMSCSARLPVYALLIGAFFDDAGPVVQGGLLLGCYALGIIAAAAVAWVFKLSARTQQASAAFILELPTYKTPQPALVGWQVWNGTKAFVVKAGTTIFCLAVLIWAASTYPKAPEVVATAAADRAEGLVRAEPKPEAGEDGEVPALEERIATARDEAVSQANLEASVAGRLGKGIEPLIAPLGFDWKVGVGLVGAFAAREVFNSTLAIIYNLGEREADDIADLSTAIRSDTRADGTPVWRPLTAISLLVWFVLAMQCISTTAVVKRETGGWTWPLIQLVGMNVMAYVACLTVFQVGRALGY